MNNLLTIARARREELQTFRLLQPGIIPDRPEYMEGESGYVQSVARTCPKCQSNDVWRGPWCTVPEMYLVLKKMKPPVKHSGRKRHSACRNCSEFWSDIQAIPYKIQDWTDDV